MKTKINGFTLVELLVVITIIAILLGLSIFGLQNARRSARDGKRQADLGTIQSGLELYKSDCNAYPATLPSVGSALTGTGTPATCKTTNVYISSVPGDPVPGMIYSFVSAGTPVSSYTLCARLEQAPSSPLPAGCGGCGGPTVTCNYGVTNP